MAHPQTWLKSILTFRSLCSSPICGLFTLSETFQTFVKCCRTAVVSLLEIYILKVIHCNPLTTGQWDVSVILHGNWYFNFHHEFHCCPARGWVSKASIRKYPKIDFYLFPKYVAFVWNCTFNCGRIRKVWFITNFSVCLDLLPQGFWEGESYKIRNENALKLGPRRIKRLVFVSA